MQHQGQKPQRNPRGALSESPWQGQRGAGRRTAEDAVAVFVLLQTELAKEGGGWAFKSGVEAALLAMAPELSNGAGTTAEQIPLANGEASRAKTLLQ